MTGDGDKGAEARGRDLDKGGTEQGAAGTKPLREYTDNRQAAVAEWVSLWPIFEVCVKETGYEVGGKLRETWWRQAAAEQQLEANLKKNRQQQGRGGDGNPTGVVRRREGS